MKFLHLTLQNTWLKQQMLEWNNAIMVQQTSAKAINHLVSARDNQVINQSRRYLSLRKCRRVIVVVWWDLGNNRWHLQKCSKKNCEPVWKYICLSSFTLLFTLNSIFMVAKVWTRILHILCIVHTFKLGIIKLGICKKHQWEVISEKMLCHRFNPNLFSIPMSINEFMWMRMLERKIKHETLIPHNKNYSINYHKKIL